jgi:tetratricopeptide (TPR) repeat protein
VSASRDDGTVRLWDANTGRQLLALPHHQVISVAFSPDGWRIASGTVHYEFIQLWDAAPKQPDEPAQTAAWFKYHAEKQQRDKAVAALARLDQQLPGDVNLWRTAGSVYFDAGHWDEAAYAFAEARKRDEPGNACTYHNRIGDCRARQGRRDEAIVHYTEAIRAGLSLAATWRKRGDCYAALRQWDRALADYTEVLNRQSDDASLWRVWRDRGNCLGEQGRWSEAAADFDQASRRYPDDPALWYYRAVALLAANDLDGYRGVCAEMLRRFCNLDQPGTASWAPGTCVYLRDAVADFRPLVRLDEQVLARAPSNWYFLHHLGAAQYRAGLFGEAVSTLEAAQKVHPRGGNADSWFFLAMAHHHRGHADDARDTLKKASAWTERATREDVNDVRMPTPLRWNDRVLLGLLRREAEELINGKPKPETKKEVKK